MHNQKAKRMGWIQVLIVAAICLSLSGCQNENPLGRLSESWRQPPNS
jgi:hypothetical protein